MAPSRSIFLEMSKRQNETSTESGSGSSTAGVPTCVVTCMGTAPTTECSGPSDWTCLCASSDYITAVGQCWATSCSAEDAVYGQAYASQACAFYGVPLNGTGTSTGTTSPTATEAIGTPDLSPPQVLSSSYIKVQAIMSSISSLLLAIALILGLMSCRARYKRDQASSQNRTWNGVTGLTSMDSTAPTSKSRFFRSTHSSGFENSRNATSTFQSDNFGVTSSNYGGTTLANSPQGQSFSGDGNGNGLTYPATTASRGFTNRLTLAEMNKSEEWELNDVKGTDNSQTDLDGMGIGISPTSFESKMESELETRLNEGSTVALNVLPKEGDGRTHAI
ncbi:uncharacterized protein IL334_001640 [Kwoniella shivajii]|uniref:CFEM domain-containing protein n=1 Tax=Kwoniella shivajii TaxID=564305 RepID=A0ABZ1CSH9_9TREE|nr:hypothetical protein IL334_001640 [Kwoniella shivajii]